MSWPGESPDAPSTISCKSAAPKSTQDLATPRAMLDGWSIWSPGVPTFRRLGQLEPTSITHTDEHSDSGDKPRNSARRSEVFDFSDEPISAVGEPILLPHDSEHHYDAGDHATEESAPTIHAIKKSRGECPTWPPIETTKRPGDYVWTKTLPTTTWRSSVTNDTARPAPGGFRFRQMHVDVDEPQGHDWCTADHYQVEEYSRFDEPDRFHDAILAFVGGLEDDEDDDDNDDDDDHKTSAVEIGVDITADYDMCGGTRYRTDDEDD